MISVPSPIQMPRFNNPLVLRPGGAGKGRVVLILMSLLRGGRQRGQLVSRYAPRARTMAMVIKVLFRANYLRTTLTLPMKGVISTLGLALQSRLLRPLVTSRSRHRRERTLMLRTLLEASKLLPPPLRRRQGRLGCSHTRWSQMLRMLLIFRNRQLDKLERTPPLLVNLPLHYLPLRVRRTRR